MSARLKSVKVLVADADKATLRLVRAEFESDHYEVVLARDGEQALAAAAERAPDVVVLELSLPAVSGLEVCRRLRTWFEGPILFLSGHDEEDVVVEALDLGADDYLTKPFRPKELRARVRALERRSVQPSPSGPVLRFGELRIDFAWRRVTREGREIRLTRTEFDILAFLVQKRNMVVTPREVMEKVWGTHQGDYAQTIRVHVGHIRKKIEPKPSEPRYLLTEAGVGYRFAAPEAKSVQAAPEAESAQEES